MFFMSSMFATGFPSFSVGLLFVYDKNNYLRLRDICVQKRQHIKRRTQRNIYDMNTQRKEEITHLYGKIVPHEGESFPKHTIKNKV